MDVHLYSVSDLSLHPNYPHYPTPHTGHHERHRQRPTDILENNDVPLYPPAVEYVHPTEHKRPIPVYPTWGDAVPVVHFEANPSLLHQIETQETIFRHEGESDLHVQALLDIVN